MRPMIKVLFLTMLLTKSAYCGTPYGYWSVPNGGATTFSHSGGYQQLGPGLRYNAYTGSTHIQGVAVHRPTGTYHHVGNGYYRNWTNGNVYNPQTGSYSSGKRLSFSPGNYQQFGNMRMNSVTGSVHIPGRVVMKRSGVYHSLGNGYYRNHVTGNIYNPWTQAYKSR